MTGYVRQSTADIAAGEVVRAAPVNNEFNALESAFGGASGHAHDGTTGNAPKIVLTTSVSGVLPIANGGTAAGTAATARTSLGVEIGEDVQAYSSALDALAALATSGIIVRTGASTYAGRTLTGTANELTVTNGDGVSGNPTLSIPTALTFTGKTVTGGTFTGGTFSGTWSGAFSSSSATITGGSIVGITDLAIADGGTGASTATNARTNLGLGTMATQDSDDVNITGGSITGISVEGTINTATAVITGGSITGITDIAVADGGTGASTASGARTNLGISTIGNTGSASDLGSGTVASARVSGSYTGITGTGALDAGSITSGFGTISTGDNISGANLAASGTVIATGAITSGSTVTSAQNFVSSTTNVVLATPSAGTVFLRPNGAGSGTGQTTLDSAGTLTVNGAVVAVGIVYSGNGTGSLQTNGNIFGSLWSSWGSGDAFNAINSRIEARGLAWRNDAINNIMPTIAAQGAAAVGSYAFLKLNAGGSYGPNTASPGSSLSWSSAASHNGGVVGGGSWRLMGGINGTAEGAVSLWLRYA